MKFLVMIAYFFVFLIVFVLLQIISLIRMEKLADKMDDFLHKIMKKLEYM